MAHEEEGKKRCIFHCPKQLIHWLCFANNNSTCAAAVGVGVGGGGVGGVGVWGVVELVLSSLHRHNIGRENVPERALVAHNVKLAASVIQEWQEQVLLGEIQGGKEVVKMHQEHQADQVVVLHIIQQMVEELDLEILVDQLTQTHQVMVGVMMEEMEDLQDQELQVVAVVLVEQEIKDSNQMQMADQV